AHAQRAGVGRLLADDHPKERGLARAVRTDDADDAAGRETELHAVDQKLLAERLAHAIRIADDVAEARAGRDVDLELLNLLLGFLREQRLVLVDARFPFGMPPLRRHADPFELALERLLPLRLRVLFE